MRLNGLIKPIKDSKEFKNIMNSVEDNNYPIGIVGISESGRSYLIDSVYNELNKSFLILTHSDMEARKLYEDLSFYETKVYYFPTKEVVFYNYNIEAISGDLRWERLKVIRQMLNRGKKIIITCIEALSYTYIPVKLYKQYTFKLSVGKNLELNELSKSLIQSGYERVDVVNSKGQFSIRGGILDIYVPILAQAYRVELFGDEIESIRSFNTETQRSIEKVKSIEIFPAKEIILDNEKIENGCKAIEKDKSLIVEKLENVKDYDTKKNIDEIINRDLESLKESWSFETIDSFLPYFYDTPSLFLDYVKDYLVILDDVNRCNGKLDSVYFEFEQNYRNTLEKGSVLPKQFELIVDKSKILENLKDRDIITMDAIPKSNKELVPKTIVEFSEITLNNYKDKMDLFIEDIKQKKLNGFKILILAGTRPRGERLAQTLRDRDIESTYKDNVDEIKSGEIVITFGSQLNGFEYPDLKLSIISNRDAFGVSKRKKRKKSPRKGVGKITSFTELRPGDYVVHVNHGIGVYKGIKQLEVQGHKKDYLELMYYSDDKLYVPVEQFDMVQRYIGNEGKNPKINKLGSADWAKAKRKAKKSIEQIAEDLVKLYAVRSTVKGYKYSKDTVWQKQFEDEFPYEETPDQLSAIEDIKTDMQSDKVMDRLLCGDVGYGKTEVAVRAVFKAVMDGKQVAFLVPTTILAQQHYNNFVKRFSDFPIKIDMISRFRTASEQKKTIKSLKSGELDILIGTHRILQKDVQFKDLGFLIIDEEQRFGVTHKEKIKKMKKNIDVLTLSATPIPRTLHMSLVGVRDISVIETPPEQRRPIQTYVVEYNDQLIRDALLREIGRGGQVYFVYNRVESISKMAVYITKLVPEARLTVAHGQMQERELETAMISFMNNESDVLLCTTIIETGMDIQNVNTMIIYDADKMGLSQLYQLRGRVGRTDKIAYCYLTYRKDKILTEVAEKRLKAIKDFTELGSGFKIALKDLEIRGAGNMMGSSQHGHMAAIGYDLYCNMLEDTIKLIKGEINEEPIETTVELKVDAYIPNDYINNEVQKIEIYKKIAAIDSYDDMMDIQEEIEDRFSIIPESVYNLMNISYIRSVGKKLGIEEIKDNKDEVVFLFQNEERISQDVLKSVLKHFGRNIILKLSGKPGFGYRIKDIKRKDLILKVKEMIEFMLKAQDKND
ncbi:transcription-repair coupling factor [Clostridium tyrobutyricum]|uniref:transcription-repair coupling factor n=1 Tax=Clostridium tyrobutyricum TaxID=1519 RepID=UPI00073DB0E5|nr:transcription-repair coupling factor [Clostridium tyrobutyricum]MBV4416692.1 transcription-repair coupling factor [Clostridium tyrobutyricum]MBV4422565.1 transcription-repair coupling factor [Clostridium tyrobutyricum]MBV4429013.1 transcription-repair coupling factor [Clostridium tyrobutyricum]MBV4431728.1 transcription-repair coupling factor [Clostridium tyrobutyricum]MBV4444087.1 transcription-repair coupling factor [Clostridium tyrobutyricum]